MTTIDVGRGVFTVNDLRRLFDALQVARPDLAEALNILRVALGLREAFEDYGQQRVKLLSNDW